MIEPEESYDPAWEFRMLYDAVLSYEGAALYADFLVPWLERNNAAREWLLEFSHRQGSPIPPAAQWELHALYAVNRVNDLLLGAFQTPTVSEWPDLGVSMDQYVAFMTGLGFEVVEAAPFSPFYHEVVEVAAQADDDASVELTDTVWPCLMLGNMLFSRAGVKVRSGRRWLHPELAAATTLYWTFCRRHRPYQDLSHGWGSNSRWRTDFRRDYRFGPHIHLNVDAERDVTQGSIPGRPPCELTLEERIELLTHRCFVTQTTAHDDQFPYWYSMSRTEDV